MKDESVSDSNTLYQSSFGGICLWEVIKRFMKSLKVEVNVALWNKTVPYSLTTTPKHLLYNTELKIGISLAYVKQVA